MKNTTAVRKPIRFSAPTRFTVEQIHAGEVRARTRIEFAKLQRRLVQSRLVSTRKLAHRQEVERVAIEAAAVAWTTPFPLLLMPELFEEKVQLAEQRADLQADIQERSHSFAELTLETESR
jgi:hypothetical protein